MPSPLGLADAECRPDIHESLDDKKACGDYIDMPVDCLARNRNSIQSCHRRCACVGDRQTLADPFKYIIAIVLGLK